MQSYIDAVKEYSRSFVASLMARGLDYRLGLVLFTDYIEKVYEPTQNVDEFLNWLKPIRAQGGMDEKENALEALAASTKLKYRPSANKVVVLITDAPYHQRSESGGGSTSYTTETICDTLMMSDIRVFSITNPLIKEYNTIAKKTRGSVYNIEESFAKLLDNFSTQLTNLYALKYISSEPALPDSVEIGIVDTRQSELVLVKKIIPIIEIGRKLIIENLLFELNSFALRDSVDELEIIAGFLNRKQNVRIQVEGHTDSKGSRALNQKLSERRAGAVKDYLIARGVQASRINVVGYGEDRPIATNETEFGRSLNRRTEIVIVDK
jgi:outer membrane protein OmpA-like peptidoglycan-associated protein